jgi:hypothetical protein
VDALRLDHSAFGFELRNPLVELFEDGFNGFGFALGLDHVVAFGIDRQARVLLLDGAEERVDLRERLDLVAEHLDAIGGFVVGGKDFDHVAANSEGAATEV